MGTRSFGVRFALTLALGLSAAGCSLDLPTMNLLGAGNAVDDDVTGSLATVADGEAVAEEKAVAVALDPRADGAVVRWSDPKTGRRGSVVATGAAFVSQDKLCRQFSKSVETGAGTARFAGSACRIGAGSWSVGELSPLPDRA